jgi:hypothetical protein
MLISLKQIGCFIDLDLFFWNDVVHYAILLLLCDEYSKKAESLHRPKGQLVTVCFLTSV